MNTPLRLRPSLPPCFATPSLSLGSQQVDDNLMKVLNQIIQILTSNDVIGPDGAEVLALLGKAKSPILMAALSRFHETNDLAELFETLHMLAAEGAKMLKGESGGGDDGEDDGDGEEEGGYDDDQFDDYDSSEVRREKGEWNRPAR